MTENKQIEKLKANSSKNRAKKSEDMGRIMSEMQVKLKEIEHLRKELMRDNYNAISPQKSKALLEEIKVPSLEMIKEEKKR